MTMSPTTRDMSPTTRDVTSCASTDERGGAISAFTPFSDVRITNMYVILSTSWSGYWHWVSLYYSNTFYHTLHCRRWVKQSNNTINTGLLHGKETRIGEYFRGEAEWNMNNPRRFECSNATVLSNEQIKRCLITCITCTLIVGLVR